MSLRSIPSGSFSSTAQIASEYGAARAPSSAVGGGGSSMKASGSHCSYSVTEVEPSYEDHHRSSYPGSNISSNRKKRLMQQRCALHCGTDSAGGGGGGDSPAMAIKNATGDSDQDSGGGENKGLKFWRSCLTSTTATAGAAGASDGNVVVRIEDHHDCSLSSGHHHHHHHPLEDDDDLDQDSLVESVEEEVILEETKDGIRVKSMKQVHQETIRSTGSSKFESRFDPSAKRHYNGHGRDSSPVLPPPQPPHIMTLPRAKPERKIKEDFCTGCNNRDNHYADISNRYSSLPPVMNNSASAPKKPKRPMARSIPPPLQGTAASGGAGTGGGGGGRPMFESRRVPEVLKTSWNPNAAGNYHTISHYSYFKRPVPMEYYSPAPHQTQDYFRLPPPISSGVPVAPGVPRLVDFSAQTLGRTKKEAKAIAKTASHHQAPSRLRKFLIKTASAGHHHQPNSLNSDQFKMYSWSPYDHHQHHYAAPPPPMASFDHFHHHHQQGGGYNRRTRPHFPHQIAHVHQIPQTNAAGSAHQRKINELRF